MTRTCLLLICLWLSQSAWAAKWALLIEIGRYPAGRQSLNTSRDAYWMNKVLREQGFMVKTLPDETATAYGIREAFEVLYQRCKEGDKVVIHYGGHGTQLTDEPGGDEIDGKDEALVPYDAPLSTSPGYNHAKAFIRDDELGIYLARLRQRVRMSGHVLILIDACHSGTLLRGQDYPRTDNILTQIPPDTATGPATSGWFDLPVVRTGRSTGAIVLIAGARAGLSQYEILDADNKPVGPLAFSFSQLMARVNKQATYKSLFDQMKTLIHREATRQQRPRSTPTVEGDSLARLLGGDLVLPTLLIRVQLTDRQRFRQSKGVLLGYTKGSEVTVRIARGDTVQRAGRVVEATAFESVIELAEPMPTTDSVYLQTSLLIQALQTGTVRVKLSGLAQHPRGNELTEWLRATPGVELVADGADWLIRANKITIDLCRVSDGERLEQVGADQIASVPGRLMAHAQASWFRQLDLHSMAMQATMVLTPVRFAPDSDSILTTLPTEWRSGLPVFRTDQQALFEIRNTGTMPFYFSLIDILPDAVIAVPLPNNKYPATSLRLLPGQVRSFPLVTISPPLGLETYKLLLTTTPVDISALVQSRGARVDDGSAAHPLAKLLVSHFRNAPDQSLPLNEVGLSDCRFWVDEPKR